MGNSVSVAHCQEAVSIAAVPEETKVEIEEPTPIVEEPEPVKEIKVETAPLDPRFPTVNQARYCFVRYNEAHKCFKEHGQDDARCARLARDYRSICPSEWVAAWNELRENDAWFGKY